MFYEIGYVLWTSYEHCIIYLANLFKIMHCARTDYVLYHYMPTGSAVILFT